MSYSPVNRGAAVSRHVSRHTPWRALSGELQKIRHELRDALPGLHLVAAVALVSRYLHGLIPSPVIARAVSEVLLALLLGVWIRNVVGFSPRFAAGTRFALNRLLRLGIILLGLRLSLQDVFRIGASSLLLVLACVAVALLLTYVFGRLFRLPPRLAALIGVGTAICGNSAIVATAPVIEARDEDVSFAVATITFFGTLTVILYPLLGRLFGLADAVYGLWAGTAVNDTSMVLAASSAYSAVARDVATVVKLTRNTLMAPLIVLVGLIYARLSSGERRKAGAAPGLSAGKVVPWFVVGFLLMALLRTAGVALGVLPPNVDQPGDLRAAAAVLVFLDDVSKLAILMALSAIGLNTAFAQLRKTGLRPFLAGLFAAAALAVFSLTVILLAGLGRAT